MIFISAGSGPEYLTERKAGQVTREKKFSLVISVEEQVFL